jgi:hypothetical protein
MANAAVLNDNMECPLCLGQGQLTRAEILQRLGMKDLARIAQLSAEEAFRLLLKEHKEEENALWLRFENELNKRINEATQKHKNEIQALQTAKTALQLRLSEFEKNQDAVVKNAKESERLEAAKALQLHIVALNTQISDLEAKVELFEEQKKVELEKLRNELGSQVVAEQSENTDLNRKAKDYLKEIAELRAKNQNLEMEMSKVARVGKKEEISFEEEAQTWPGIWLSEKLKKYGDYLLAFRDLSGQPLDPKLLIDNKDKSTVTEDDIEKLIRDAGEQNTPVAALIAKDECQLRTLDKEQRWACSDGVWILRTTRQWVHRDLDILKPLFDTMREEGSDFLTKNSQLAEEIRRTFVDIDDLEKELKKAAKAINAAQELAMGYRIHLQQLCDSAAQKKVVSRVELPTGALSAARK